MRWHVGDSNNGGILRHPRDFEAWKQFDSIHTQFASDSINVHHALAIDGFNPFGIMGIGCSIWPIILTPYNTHHGCAWSKHLL